MTTLPAPRNVLTSLISSLTSIPIADNTTTTNTISSHRSSNQHISTTPSTNPFKLIPPACRPLLTTLHVLYPSTLLPALDLLDRRLVTRVILKQDTAHTHTQHPTTIQAGQSHTINPGQEDLATPAENEDTIPPSLYHLVRSAQPHSHRRQQTASSGGQTYIVRLESWNCTCAAFAFAAFPPLASSTFSSTPGPTVGGYHILPATTPGEDASFGGIDLMSSRENVDQPWEFGGLSTDGVDGAGSVPCCKHLLACVLAEKWNAVLGGYMEQRLVSREEAAGLVGDL